MAETPGPGAEQRYSSRGCVMADIRIKFSFAKETLCVYFKSQLFEKNKKATQNCFTMGFPGGWEKCQVEANVVFSGCEKQV